MDQLSWAGQPLSKILDESPNAEFVKQLDQACVQITRAIRLHNLRLRLEDYLVNQFTVKKFVFNGVIQNQPLPDSPAATKLFEKLGGKGIVANGYINHADDLKIKVGELDDEELDQLVARIVVIMNPVDEEKQKSIEGINAWLNLQRGLDVHSDVFPVDLQGKRQVCFRAEPKA